MVIKHFYFRMSFMFNRYIIGINLFFIINDKITIIGSKLGNVPS